MVGREDFECTYHKEMIKVQSDGYAKLSSIITQSIHESKHHFIAHKYV